MARFRPLILGFLAVAFLAVAPPAFADRAQAIQGSMDVVTTFEAPPPPATPLPLELIGAGLASISNHPGEFTVELDFDLNIDRTGHPSTFAGVISFTSKTSPNDVLYGYFFGHYTSPVNFVATIIFDGGTGLYAKASGSAELTGTDVAGPFAFHADFDGVLKLKGAKGKD